MTVTSEQDDRLHLGTYWTVILSRLRGRTEQRRKLGPLAKRRERWFFLMISPWIIGFLLFQAGPIIASGAISFTDFSLTKGVTWVGLDQYKTLINDPLARKALLNTVYYSFGSVPLGIIVAFLLAVLLNQRIRGVNIFRTIFFLPAVLEGVAVYMLWGWIFNPRFGLLNAGLDMAGIKGPPWLQSPDWAMPALILISLWRIGWMMLIYLAGLQDIPEELYEASEIDGASRWQKFRYISIPLISPVTFFLLITNVIFAMQIFTPLYVLTRGGPNNATMTISLLIFFAAFTFDRMGYASALAMVLFVIILVITATQFVGAKRWVYYASEEVQ